MALTKAHNRMIAGAWFNVLDFGAIGDGTTDDTSAIQAAIDAANAAGGGTVFVPRGQYVFNGITPKSNVTLQGVRMGSKLLQVQPVSAIQTGIYKASGGGSLSNFHVKELFFNGRREQNPANQFNHIIYVALGANETLDNFTVESCDFEDAQEDFIRVASFATTGTANKIRIVGNTAKTTDAKIFTSGTAYASAHDLIRIEQAYDYSTGGNGYGNVQFTHIEISGNYAEKIRTLGDCKRGCAYFQIVNNRTKNILDCHHSVDGSFHGVVANNVCETEASFSTFPGAKPNFIEVQGEHITCANNVGDGGGIVGSGIHFTDYGRPQEGGVGHVSVACSIQNNLIKNITGNALRFTNGHDCQIVDNIVEDVGNHVASIESGSGRDDPSGNPLVSIACRVSGNKSKGAGLGVVALGTKNIVGINPDENGQDYFYSPDGLVSTYGNFTSEGYTELNPNTLLELSTTGTNNNVKWFGVSFYPEVVAASTKPYGVPQAVVFDDDSAINNRRAELNCKYEAKQNDRFFFRYWMKKNTATAAGLVIQEYNSSDVFLLNTWLGSSSVPVDWTEYLFTYKVQNATCDYILVNVVPAENSNNPTATGKTDFANLRVSRTVIGV
jgi:hypothetical protein